MNQPALVVALLAALVSLITAMMTFRAATKANATSDRKVDLEEHRDAIDRLKRIIEEQDKQFERLRLHFERVQAQLAKEQDVSLAMRQQVLAMQNQIDDLSRSRARLEDLIALTKTKRRPDE